MEIPIIETSTFICCANQWIGFYMIGTSGMKELSAICLQTIRASTHIVFVQVDSL